MGVIGTYTAWETVRILMSSMTVDINNIITASENALKQKFDKLSIISKPMTIYEMDGTLLIHDEYETCDNFLDILIAFGFNASEIKNSMGSRCYVITDPIIDSLKMIKDGYKVKGLMAQKSTDEIKALMDGNGKHENLLDIINRPIAKTNTKEIIKTITAVQQDTKVQKKDIVYYDGSNKEEDILKIIRAYADGKQIQVQGKQKVTTYGHNVSRGEVQSDEQTKLMTILENFFGDFQDKLNKTDAQLQNGTSEIIKERVRKSGYSVSQTTVNDKIKLTLSRVVA